MESHHTSKIRFCDANDQTLESPSEWATALVEVMVPLAQWESTSVFLNQRELPLRVAKLAGTTRVLTDWPLSNPGHYELHVRCPDGEERRMVTIKPQKISTGSFEQMLLDLESSLPTSVAMGLQRMGALAGIKILPPGESTLSQEMARLRRAVCGTESRAGLAAVLEDLAERPHQILKGDEIWVKADQARRPHPARLKDAICRGYNHTSSGRLRTVLDTRVEHTFDVYENRLLRVFAFQVDQRIRALSRAITLKHPSSALVEQVHTLSSHLRRARRQASFLDGVSLPRQLPTRTTMVLLNRPSYRSAFQGFREFHKSAAMRMDEPRLDAPLCDVPYLYQLWGTMAVIQVLIDVGVSLGYRVRAQQLVRKELGGLCMRVLPDGKPAVVLVHPEARTVVKLIPERSYRKKGNIRSISFSQRPDIAIEVEAPDKETRIFLFDPKYKLQSEQSQPIADEADEAVPTGQPKKVDIDKMHSYRDAIRDPQLRRAVRYAAILYPGPEVRYADDIEALNAYPSQSQNVKSRLRDVLSAALATGSDPTAN